MLTRGGAVEEMEKTGKGKKAFRRGGIWYDPMCFPEFEETKRR